MGAFDPKGAVVVAVDLDGPAARAGLREGDQIVLVDGKAPIDLMDFQDRTSSGRARLTVQRGQERFEVEFHRDEDEPLGLEFSDTLFNRVKTCRNKCVFCFMDQMPKKMRPSLYYRDDDYRLSNLHGNFITLTNLSEEEWLRIEQQRVSPLYISVHATEEKLREELLGSTKQARLDLMDSLRQLIGWGVELHTQIVLMPGLNDGASLDRSLDDLRSLGPAVKTVSIVPVGLTRYRAHLPYLKPVTKEMIPPLIEQVQRHQEKFLEMAGERVVFLADEMYLIAEMPLPPHSYYGDYPQLENGVGMVRRFITDFNRRKRRLQKAPKGRYLLVTGEYGGQIFPPLLKQLPQHVEVRLIPVPNKFFGPLVKCSGLLAGRDILERLQKEKLDNLDAVLMPGNALKDAAIVGRSEVGLLLDNISLQALADHFKLHFVNAGSSCEDWLRQLHHPLSGQVFAPQTEPQPIVIEEYPEHSTKVAK